jgi:hypothetical protein
MALPLSPQPKTRRMKLANAIEGGITGATTLTLLQEALHKIDTDSPRPFLGKSGVLKQLKRSIKKKKGNTRKLSIQLAGELLSNAAFFGLTGLGKKKNAVLRGGLLGAAAGLGNLLLMPQKEDQPARVNGTARHLGHTREATGGKELKKKILTMTLYTAGGLLAGLAIKKLKKRGKRKRK